MLEGQRIQYDKKNSSFVEALMPLGHDGLLQFSSSSFQPFALSGPELFSA
jgi:hypothetical protein